MTTETIPNDFEPNQVMTTDRVERNMANLFIHNKTGPIEVIIEEGEELGTAWILDEEQQNKGREYVRRILEHLDSKVEFWDNETLDNHINPEYIKLENGQTQKVEEAIEEANIVDKQYESRIKNILNKHKEAISTHAYDLGKYKGEKIKIKMNDMTPISCPYRPPPPQYREQALKILEQLEKENIITRQYAPFAAQIRWVVKAAPDDHGRIPGQKLQTNKDPELRMAIDYSHMCGRVTKQQFPLTPVKKILALLRNSKVISSLDLRKAFYQIEICDESKLVWAFEGRTVIIHNKATAG